MIKIFRLAFWKIFLYVLTLLTNRLDIYKLIMAMVYPDQKVDRCQNDGRFKRGLKNLGNTCYMNSGLQMLFMCKSFRETLCSTILPNENSAFRTELRNCFKELDSQTKFPFAPSTFHNIVASSPLFPKNRQHDSSEFMRHVLDQIHEEESQQREDSANESHTMARNYFGVKIENCFVCPNPACKDEMTIEEDFYDLPLDVPLSSNGPLDLVHLIGHFFTHESISMRCQNCNTNQDFKITKRVTKYPNYLIFTPMRYHEKGNSKNNTRLKYLLSIDMPLSNTSPQSEGLNYGLTGVIEHDGLFMSRGHYYCYARNSAYEDIWYRFDDQNISRTKYKKFAEYLRKASLLNTSQAILYERIQEDSSEMIHNHNGEDRQPMAEAHKQPVSRDPGVYNIVKSPKAGLQNHGSTCYANSVVQALFMCRRFRNHMINHQYERKVYKELRNLFGNLIMSGLPCSTQKFLKEARPEWFNPGRQQDSAEFIRHLFVILGEAEAIKTDRSAMNCSAAGLFQGSIVKTYFCNNCQDQEEVAEDFNDLILSFSNDSNVYEKLEDLLDGYLKPECLSIPCDKCKCDNEIIQMASIKDFPDYLVLTISRSIDDRDEKNLKEVKYPLVLIPQGTNNKQKYCLMAVIVHSGYTTYSGHYTCYARHEIPTNYNDFDYFQDEWYCFNDSRVSKTKFNDFAEGNGVRKNFYFPNTNLSSQLVYRKISEEEVDWDSGNSDEKIPPDLQMSLHSEASQKKTKRLRSGKQPLDNKEHIGNDTVETNKTGPSTVGKNQPIIVDNTTETAGVHGQNKTKGPRSGEQPKDNKELAREDTGKTNKTGSSIGEIKPSTGHPEKLNIQDNTTETPKVHRNYKISQTKPAVSTDKCGQTSKKLSEPLQNKNYRSECEIKITPCNTKKNANVGRTETPMSGINNKTQNSRYRSELQIEVNSGNSSNVVQVCGNVITQATNNSTDRKTNRERIQQTCVKRSEAPITPRFNSESWGGASLQTETRFPPIQSGMAHNNRTNAIYQSVQYLDIMGFHFLPQF